MLKDFRREAAEADIVLLEGLQDPAAAAVIVGTVAGVPSLVAFNCCGQVQAAQRLGGLPLQPVG